MRYRVTFRGAWTSESLAAGVSVPSRADFGTMVGAAHDSSVTFWQESSLAGAGVKAVAETGSTSQWASEVSTAIAASTARASISVSNGFGATASGSAFFDVSDGFPLVSLIARLAPSPDWFVGVSGLSLQQAGEWVLHKEVPLYPFDAGTEEGTGFAQNNPATDPPNPITSLSGTAPFSDQPIATLVFDRWTPVLSAADASATEGHSVQFRVTLDRRGSTDPVTVDYSTSGGTATEDADYTAAAGTLTFSSGQTTQTVSVETAVDTEIEDDEEYFTLTLRNPTDARLLDEEATGAIVDANNHPPRFAVTSTFPEVRENLPAGADFGDPVVASDREGGPLVYTLSGDDAHLFSIDRSTGQLSTAAVFDYEEHSTYPLTVTVEDPGGATAMIDVYVLVVDVDEAGTVTLTPLDAGAGQEVTAELSDPDRGATGVEWYWQRSPDRLAWTTIAGAATASYTLAAEDYQQYVRAVATYNDGQGVDKLARATLPKERPNQPPLYLSRSYTIPAPASSAGTFLLENTAPDTRLDYGGFFTDLEGQDFVCSVQFTSKSSAAPDFADMFRMDGATCEVFTRMSLDFDPIAILHQISNFHWYTKLTATDSEGAARSITWVVNVANQAEPGYLLVTSGRAVAGTEIKATLVDPDYRPASGQRAGVQWKWQKLDGTEWVTLPNGESSSFTPTTDLVGSKIRVDVRYTDASSGHTTFYDKRAVVSYNEVFGMAMAMANRAPAFGSDPINRSFAEHTIDGEKIGDPVVATDADNDTLLYTLGGADADLFSIVAHTGQLRTKAHNMIEFDGRPLPQVLFDFERRSSYSVTVTATDQAGASDTATVPISVTNADDEGTVTLSGDLTAVGGKLTGALTDPDGGVTGTTWVWQRTRTPDDSGGANISGADSSGYTLVTDDVGYFVRAVASYTDDEGSGKSAQAAWPLQVTATANRAAMFGEDSVTRSVAENSPPGTPVGDPVTADDPDGDSLRYSLRSESVNYFEIDAETGQLGVADDAVLDYERKTRHTVTVLVSDLKNDAAGFDDATDDTISVVIELIDDPIDSPSTAPPQPPQPRPTPRPGPPSPTPSPGPGPAGPSGPAEPEEPQPVYRDIEQAGVHRSAVESLHRLGLLARTECGRDRFCPGEALSRWGMAVWLVRLLDGTDARPSGQVRFTDVDPDIWWAPYVERLAELEVTLGCGDGTTFCPQDPVTRAQMASFLTRALELPTPQQAAGFTDVEPDTTHAANIDALYASRITQGCRTDPELRYCPSRHTTRAQMASFIHRAHQRLQT